MTAGEYPAEFALVLACLHWPQTPASGQHIRQLAQTPIRWPLLLDIAQYHKVTPLVARSLQTYAAEWVPEGPANLLRNSNIQNAHTCLRRIGHLLDLTRKFREHQVDVRVFKGISLSLLAFHDPTLREAGDIDLLVAETDLFAAGEILRAEGYVRFQPQGRLTPRRLQSYIAHQKDFSYAHPTAGIVIDLHWRLFRNPWLPANAAIEYLGKQWLELSSEGFNTLSPTELLPYLCMHGALDGWLRLKWLADVQALLHTMTSEQLARAAATAADQQALPQLSAAVYLCQDLLELEVPPPIQAACLHRSHPRVGQILDFSRQCMTSNQYCPVREQIPSAQWFVNEWRQHDSFRYRLDLFARSLFRPRVWSWVKLPDWLFFLYVLLGPVEWCNFHLRHYLAQRRQAQLAHASHALPERRNWRRRPRDLALAMEAMCMLSFFRMALRFLPVQQLVRWMSQPMPPRLPLAKDRQARTLRRVGWAISAAVRHAPVTFVCFPQSLAAYFMLRRRHVASTLVYGVAREDDRLKAHTWVKVGDRTIVGGEAAPNFTVLNTFP